LARKNHTVLGTPNLLRLVNRNTILSLLEQMDVTSRAELSALSGLSPPTVSAIVKELVDEGWVQSAGGGVSQGGKPPQLIRLNPDARFVGAIQMNRDKIRIRITNLLGTVFAEEQVKLEESNGAVICAETARRFLDLATAQNMDLRLLLGVGVAVPGVVNDQGMVSNAPEFGWHREPIKEYLSQHLRQQVVVENDVKLAAVGDAWKRRLLSDVVVYVHLDRGIGAGILIDGKLFKGSHFAAGEIGNLIVNPDNLGKTPIDAFPKAERPGYFEAQYGLTALDLSVSDAVDTAKREDWIIRHLAYAMVNIIALLDPDTIVFGGRMTSRIDNFLGKLLSALSELVEVAPKMYITPLGSDASLVGATRAVIENYKEQVTWTTV
jgi:predicted NBD/HSP70 family sugar kinase